MNTFLKRSSTILAICVLTLKAVALSGSWRGDLNVGATSIPLIFNFANSDAATSCTLDSPKQNAFGIPASVDFESADSIAVSVGILGAAFEGRIANDEINGKFTQQGHCFPLTLTRELPLIERRPQTPQPPFPYQEIDTVFYSIDNTALSGTFALPNGFTKGKTPMCVFVTGSGQQNRDEEIFEHRPFAVIADFLARNGIASFRYDDRGTAKSEGNFAASTIDTFKDDAKSALLFAKSLNAAPAGIIGHSEGGTIALLLGQEGLPDFIVSLAGMAVSGKQTVLEQNVRLLKNSGMTDSAIENSMALINALFDEIILQDGNSAGIDVDSLTVNLGVDVPSALVQSLKKNLPQNSPYFRKMLSTDARKGMNKIKCPVLALNGSLDTQVLAKENLDAIRNGVKNARAIELPELNHLFQHATTGEVAEYSQIKETISPEVLALILSFIQDL